MSEHGARVLPRTRVVVGPAYASDIGDDGPAPRADAFAPSPTRCRSSPSVSAGDCWGAPSDARVVYIPRRGGGLSCGFQPVVVEPPKGRCA